METKQKKSNSECVNSAQAAVKDRKLLQSSLENLQAWLQEGFLPQWAITAISELIENEQWDELNDRFYKTLAFGTGGMRGRTMGKVTTQSERGDVEKSEFETPQYPAVGTSYLNDFNIIKATIGLYRYSASYLKSKDGASIPKLVIAHDVRHFSRHFCLLAASTWKQLGGEVMVFDGPRSTPQLSFSVRHFKATAGIVITASHNPPHDNGYKVYFADGAQIISPHAEGIIKEFNAVELKEIPAYLEVKEEGITVLGGDADSAYHNALKENILDAGILKSGNAKIVFSSIHGTGRIASIPMLREYEVDVVEVPEQAVMDPRFPTVKSPNPENAEALTLAIKKAKEIKADVVLATDPDADRMGAAVRNKAGEMELITGNMIGCLLADYRIKQFKKHGLLPQNGTKSAAVIKTFVTTPLLEAITEGHGLKFINTLTGFKWIGGKIREYEDGLMSAQQGSFYDTLSFEERAKALLEHSTFFVFGTEESYGYLGSERVRDKDANGAVLMFSEMLSSLKAQGKSVLDYLDDLYAEHGYYLEDQLSIYYEGATGAQKIKNILDSYRLNPPKEIDGVTVDQFKDFGREKIIDADGRTVPPQDFYFLELANGYRYAVRGSGTEPKIKFYIFAHEAVVDISKLAEVKSKTHEYVKKLEAAIDRDARKRAEG